MLLKKGTILALVMVALTACENKFADKTPDHQNTDGLSASDRIAADNQLDKKLSEFDDFASKVRELLSRSSKVGSDSYTQLDFFLDINDEIKKSPAQMAEGRFMRQAAVKLPVKGLSADCQTVDARVETTTVPTSDTTVAAANQGSNAILYSLRTCTTDGKFLPVMTINTTKAGSALEFEDTNVRKALVDSIWPAVSDNTSCTFKSNDQFLVASIECLNVTAKIDDKTKVVLDDLALDPGASDVMVKIIGKIYENDQAKESINVVLGPKGQSVDLNRVQSATK